MRVVAAARGCLSSASGRLDGPAPAGTRRWTSTIVLPAHAGRAVLAPVICKKPLRRCDGAAIQLLPPSGLPPQTRNDNCSRIRGRVVWAREGCDELRSRLRIPLANPSELTPLLSPLYKAHVPVLSVVHQNGWFDSCAPCALRSVHWESAGASE